MLSSLKNKNDNQYVAVIYARLSVEEIKRLKKNNQTESSSIDSQINMLKSFAEEKNISIGDICIDDGRTGQRFIDRPGFQKSIKLLEEKKVNTIITKDMSRLGRDLIDTCTYIQRYFPQNDIRYLAYLDDYDSLCDDATDERIVNKITKNDTFSKTVSVNVRSGKRARAKLGLFMGTYAPYRI